MKRRRSFLFAIFLLYLAFSLFLTFPLAFSLNRYPLFDHLDLALTFANFWYQYYALFHLKINPWHSPLLNYPDGYNLVFFPLYFSYGVFSYPWQALFGTPRVIPGFFNWLCILSFTFTGLIGFLLFQRFTQSTRASILAGILFSFIPFHYWHLPRCHLSCLEFMLLPIYFYFRLWEEKNLKFSFYFGLALVPLFYQSPNYLFYLILFFALHLVYLLFTNPGQFSPKGLKNLSLSLMIALLLAIPYLTELLRELSHQSRAGTSTLQEQIKYSADLLGFFLPSFNQKLYSSLGLIGERLIGNSGLSGKEIFPGYLLLLTGLAGIFLGRSQIKNYGFWLLVLFTFLLLSLGPYLNCGTHLYSQVPLPYYFLRKILPPLGMERGPGRMVILGFLALAVFSAGFFQWLEEKIKPERRRKVFLLFGLMALLELNQAPFKLDRIELPAFYQELSQEQEPFTILDLPLLPDIERYAPFYQCYHKKNLVLSPRRGKELSEQGPLVFYLDTPQRFYQLSPEKQKNVREQIQKELRRREIKYIIIWLRFISPAQQAELEQLLAELSPVRVFNSEGLFKVYQYRAEAF